MILKYRINRMKLIKQELFQLMNIIYSMIHRININIIKLKIKYNLIFLKLDMKDVIIKKITKNMIKINKFFLKMKI